MVAAGRLILEQGVAKSRESLGRELRELRGRESRESHGEGITTDIHAILADRSYSL